MSDEAFKRQSSFFSAILSGKKPDQPEKVKEYELWEDDDIAGIDVLESVARWTGVSLTRVKELGSMMQQAWEEEDTPQPTLKRIREIIKVSETSAENIVIGFLYGLAIGRYHAMKRDQVNQIKAKLAETLGKDGIKSIVALSPDDAINKLKGIMEKIVDERRKESEG